MKNKKTRPNGPLEDTESIEVTTFAADVTQSGSFNITQFRKTSFSKLLHALPVPALLIDDSHHIIFANQACRKINSDPEKLLGLPVADISLFSAASKGLQSLLENVSVDTEASNL